MEKEGTEGEEGRRARKKGQTNSFIVSQTFLALVLWGRTRRRNVNNLYLGSAFKILVSELENCLIFH